MTPRITSALFSMDISPSVQPGDAVGRAPPPSAVRHTRGGTRARHADLARVRPGRDSAHSHKGKGTMADEQAVGSCRGSAESRAERGAITLPVVPALVTGRSGELARSGAGRVRPPPGAASSAQPAEQKAVPAGVLRGDRTASGHPVSEHRIRSSATGRVQEASCHIVRAPEGCATGRGRMRVWWVRSALHLVQDRYRACARQPLRRHSVSQWGRRPERPA